MRNLLFSPGFPPVIGGQPNYMYARCKAVPDDLDVIAMEWEGSEDFDAKQPFRIYRFQYFWKPVHPIFDPLKRIIQLYQSVRVLKERLNSEKYDVVEVNSFFPGVIAAQFLPSRQYFRLVCYALGDDVLHPQSTWYAKSIFRWALQQVDLFIAISHYTRDVLIDAGVPPEKVVIIYPPLDQERFSEPGDVASIKEMLPPHDLMLLTICRLSPKKNVDQIIQLMPKLKQRFPNLLYVVGGYGPDLERLQLLAKQRQVEDSVIFLGKIPEDKLVNLYAAADVFVMSTRPDSNRVEGFGIVFLEAGSQGVPVIGPNIGGSEDAIIHGETGYLVDPYDPDDIENRIVELLSDPNLRHKLGEAGKKRAFRPSDWSPLLNLK